MHAKIRQKKHIHFDLLSTFRNFARKGENAPHYLKQKYKYGKTRKILLCLFALLSLVQGAKADGYITDIMTISGGSSSIKNQYIEQGWTVADGDLNSGAGGDYEGYDVTDAWNGSDVTDTGANMPNWNNDAVRNTCTRVVFDESFAEARPKSLCQWFSLQRLQCQPGFQYHCDVQWLQFPKHHL